MHYSQLHMLWDQTLLHCSSSTDWIQHRTSNRNQCSPVNHYNYVSASHPILINATSDTATQLQIPTRQVQSRIPNKQVKGRSQLSSFTKAYRVQRADPILLKTVQEKKLIFLDTVIVRSVRYYYYSTHNFCNKTDMVKS